MSINGEFQSTEHYVVYHEVGHNQAGIRLDAFLKERYRKRSRESLKAAIESGAIRVERNGGPHLQLGRLKPASQLLVGDRVLVDSERKPEPEVDFNYHVLFEDDVLFVIHKPANLPVHPAGRYFFNTLLVHLKTEGLRNPLNAEREFFLVHRIDKETSGILVLTKDREVCTDLTRQFAERKTRKRYLAVVRGIPAQQEFVVDVSLRRALRSRVELKMEVVPPGVPEDAPDTIRGQTALTSFRVLETAGDFALVECFPKTGRQHQIRVHLEHAGHPIVGDKLYGIDEEEAARFFERKFLSPEAEAKLLLPRHALHSCLLGFTHPRTGKEVTFESPLPPDLRAFLDRQRHSSSPR
jgi:23S rRNA pseudouridine1911/1915/1917 synthase